MSKELTKWLVDRTHKETKMMATIFQSEYISVQLSEEIDMPIQIKDITNAKTYLDSKIKTNFPEPLLTMITMSGANTKVYPHILAGITARSRHYWFGMTVKAFKPIKTVISGILHASRSRGMPMFVIYKISPTEYEIYPNLIDTLWDFIKGQKDE